MDNYIAGQIALSEQEEHNESYYYEMKQKYRELFYYLDSRYDSLTEYEKESIIDIIEGN